MMNIGENMQINRREHPRPQFIRKNWLLLDGQWKFKFDDENLGLINQWSNGLEETRQINTPFTYETQLSGINDSTQHNVIWYETVLNLNKDRDYSIIFEGVDYKCQVWLNGQLIGIHKGAYERFEFDLTQIYDGKNILVVRVEDSTACEQPRGKQRWLKNNFGCWYVQSTGIWKSVWLESHQSKQRLESVKLTPDLDNDQIIIEPRLHYLRKLDSMEYSIEIDVTFEDRLVSNYRGNIGHNMTPIAMETKLAEDAVWGTKIWSPNDPSLYDIVFRLYKDGKQIDEVYSYFGMRKISISNGQVLLNNQQLYQRLILDQGYWEESGITSPSVDALEEDINRIFEMGYNGLRKHQKIEDERFLYLCDKKGMLVWSEMAATYMFNDLSIDNFIDEWKQIVLQNYNHPSIITWVPFNESWGIKNIANDQKQQRFTESIYYLTKSLDDTRPVIVNDGWTHTISDIITLHDYEEFGETFKERYVDKDRIMANEIQFNNGTYAFAKGYSYVGQPIIISEFGGIAFTTDQKENWGYGNQVRDEESFMKRFESIHQAIQEMDYISGYCYTQLTDVEQEVNGLLTPQRQPKVNLAQVRQINERRKNVY